MNRIKTQRGLLVAVLASVVVMLGASAINADTVGYWRFESETNFLTDSGPNGFHLSTGGTTTVPTYLALPGTGAGSNFDNPIPQTGDSNTGVANFGATQDGYLSCPGTDPKFDTDTFTIEAYINWDSDLRSQIIASQCGGDDRSWQFMVGDTGNDLQFYMTEYGTHTSYKPFDSGLVLSPGTDYYVAASFDLSAQTGGVKFYLKDLTAGTDMQTATRNHDMVALHDSDLDFVIGSRDPTQYEWTGLIDEVRFSDTVLSEDELLAHVVSGLLPGDANDDGIVNDEDASILAAHWQMQSGATWADGDFNDDGKVNDEDASILAAHWQETGEETSPVPEPGVFTLLLGAMLLLIIRRR